MEFILFVQGRGDKEVQDPSKTFPAEANKAMKLKGTESGDHIFISSDADKAYMKKDDAQDKRYFNFAEILSAVQLKRVI